MKTYKLLPVIFPVMATCGAHAYYLFSDGLTGNMSNYCLYGSGSETENITQACYWCSGRDRVDTFCTSAYAGCYNASVSDIGKNQNLISDNGDMWKCTDDGWEKQTPYECYSGDGCSAGCYWDSGPYTCLSCPAPDFAAPELAARPATDNAGERSPVTDCYVMPGRGFGDNTGTFDIMGKCYYSL